jgi:flagellar basal-body rod protein FlgB
MVDSAMMIPGLTEVARALSLHAFRQQVLANDLANAHSPGFVARDVDTTSFADTLEQTLPLRASETGAVPISTAAPSDSDDDAIITSPVLAGSEGSGVDPDATMAEIAANALSYQAIATAAGSEIALAKTGIMG